MYVDPNYAIFDVGKSVLDIVHLRMWRCYALVWALFVECGCSCYYYLIVGVGEWYVGCEEAVDGCWCWWVKGGGGIEGRCR